MQFAHSSKPPDSPDEVEDARVLEEAECNSDDEDDREELEEENDFFPVGRGSAGRGREGGLLRDSRSA